MDQAIRPAENMTRLLVACGAAIFVACLAELTLAEKLSSLTPGIYLGMLLLAFALGATQRAHAWIVGMMLVPSYWFTATTHWPTTSTVGAGHLFAILIAIPHAIAAQIGMWVWRLVRRARSSARADAQQTPGG